MTSAGSSSWWRTRPAKSGALEAGLFASPPRRAAGLQAGALPLLRGRLRPHPGRPVGGVLGSLPPAELAQYVGALGRRMVPLRRRAGVLVRPGRAKRRRVLPPLPPPDPRGPPPGLNSFVAGWLIANLALLAAG